MTAETDKPHVHAHAGLQPIVIEYRSRKNKPKVQDDDDGREKYSKDLRDFEEGEGRLVRVMKRTTRAVAQGVDTYDRERRRSAKEKKDGPIEDFPHNAAKAVSEALREGADIPIDLAEAFAPKDYRRRVRRSLKRVSKGLRLFRL